MVRFGLLLAALFVVAPLTASAQVGEKSYNVTFFSTDGTFEGVMQFSEDGDDDPADSDAEAGDIAISVGPDAPDVNGTYEATTTGIINTITTFEVEADDEDGAFVRLSGTVEGKKISGSGVTGNGVLFFFFGREQRTPIFGN